MFPFTFGSHTNTNTHTRAHFVNACEDLRLRPLCHEKALTQNNIGRSVGASFVRCSAILRSLLSLVFFMYYILALRQWNFRTQVSRCHNECALPAEAVLFYSLSTSRTHIHSRLLLSAECFRLFKNEIFHRQRIEALGLNLCRCTYAPRFYKLCLLASNKFFLLLIFFPWSLLSAQGSKELNKNIFAVIFSFIATFFAPQICPFVLVVFSTISIFTRYFKRYLFSEQKITQNRKKYSG